MLSLTFSSFSSIFSHVVKLSFKMTFETIAVDPDNVRSLTVLRIFISASLETLQRWVVELFGEIKEGGHGRLPIPCDRGRIWEPNRLYRVAAEMETTSVDITWPLPCLESVYLSKPQDYYGHIIGHGDYP